MCSAVAESLHLGNVFSVCRVLELSVILNQTTPIFTAIVLSSRSENGVSVPSNLTHILIQSLENLLRWIATLCHSPLLNNFDIFNNQQNMSFVDEGKVTAALFCM